MPDETKNEGKGYLIVQVSTANTAIPLSGAAIQIAGDTGNERDDGDVLLELRSGADGRSERVALPTLPREDSQTPQVERPYFTYNIRVSLRGYGTGLYLHIPIFDGITSLTQADLIPLPDNGRTDGGTRTGTTTYENFPPDL